MALRHEDNILDDENASGESSVGALLEKLEDFTPTIPDAVAAHYLKLAGLETNDTRLIRFFSVAVQKFISDILLDAMQQAKMRGVGAVSTKRGGAKEVKYTLNTDVLGPVLEDYGIFIRRPVYMV